jgi:hypothetical protein
MTLVTYIPKVQISPLLLQNSNQQKIQRKQPTMERGKQPLIINMDFNYGNFFGQFLLCFMDGYSVLFWIAWIHIYFWTTNMFYG